MTSKLPVRGHHLTATDVDSSAKRVTPTKASPTAASLSSTSFHRKTPSPTMYRGPVAAMPPLPQHHPKTSSAGAHSRSQSGDVPGCSPSAAAAALSSAYTRVASNKSASPIDLCTQEKLNLRHCELLSITSPANPLMDAGDFTDLPATSPPNVGATPSADRATVTAIPPLPLGRLGSAPSPHDAEADGPQRSVRSAVTDLAQALLHISESYGASVDELLSSLTAAVKPSSAAQPYTPIAVRQNPTFGQEDRASPKISNIRIDTALLNSFSGGGGGGGAGSSGSRAHSNQDDAAGSGASDSDASSAAGNHSGDEDDSDHNQYADEQEHEHYRELRRHRYTPLGARPQMLSKFHVGLKTPESCVRRTREIDSEVLSALAAKGLEAPAVEREAAPGLGSVPSLTSPSPNTYRILHGNLPGPNDKMFESAVEMLSRSHRPPSRAAGEDLPSNAAMKAMGSPKRRTPTAGSPPAKVVSAARGKASPASGPGVAFGLSPAAAVSKPRSLVPPPSNTASANAAISASLRSPPGAAAPKTPLSASKKSSAVLKSKPSSKSGRSSASRRMKSRTHVLLASPPSHIAAHGPPSGVMVPKLKLSPRFLSGVDDEHMTPNASRAVDLNSPRSSAFSKASSLHSGSPRSVQLD